MGWGFHFLGNCDLNLTSQAPPAPRPDPIVLIGLATCRAGGRRSICRLCAEGHEAARAAEQLCPISIIQRMPLIGGGGGSTLQQPGSDYVNGSRVSPGYLPFLFNWQAWLEHSIGLLQEANSIRGVLNSQWREQP